MRLLFLRLVQLQFDVIGFTEKELGHSIIERANNIYRIRKALTVAGLEEIDVGREQHFVPHYESFYQTIVGLIRHKIDSYSS